MDQDHLIWIRIIGSGSGSLDMDPDSTFHLVGLDYDSCCQKGDF